MRSNLKNGATFEVEVADPARELIERNEVPAANDPVEDHKHADTNEGTL